MLRAYDNRGWIHPATRVHDGSDPEAAIAAVLAEPGVVEVHSRNIAYGCFMFAVTARLSELPVATRAGGLPAYAPGVRMRPVPMPPTTRAPRSWTCASG